MVDYKLLTVVAFGTFVSDTSSERDITVRNLKKARRNQICLSARSSVHTQYKNLKMDSCLDGKGEARE